MQEYVVIVNSKEKCVTPFYWRASMKMRDYEKKGLEPRLARCERVTSK